MNSLVTVGDQYGVQGGLSRRMSKGFSLIELIIVASIIGILASLVVPAMENRATEAKMAAAREDLHLLRVAIRLYSAQHGGIAPGYADNDYGGSLGSEYFLSQTITQARYLHRMPENPFNERDTIFVLDNSASFPTDASGAYGWIYQPASETIRLDWPGTDNTGVRYYDY